uniref:NBS-LRR-like resistance protein n=1 Tax=Oryza sativa TaxID=4530 RepID=A0A0U2RPT0_ORYSA|nr:NBS-LRR-like resistance protein [Oryza sativa]
MAIVLDAFASYVGDLLKQVAKDEVNPLFGVSGEIATLHDKLRILKDYLADADRRRITDQGVQGWVTKLKHAMYDATDILDLCHLKAMQRQRGGGSSSSSNPVGCLDSLLFCLRNPLFAHDIGSRIKALNTRLDAICKSAAAFSFLKLEAYEDMAAPRRFSATDRRTDPVLGKERSGVVGEKIEEDTRALVQRLTNGNTAMTTIMVVAVVGTGGIGKTTLAKKVFNDETIQKAFHKKIWLSVTEDENEVELLREAIKSAGGGSGAGDARDSNSKSLLVDAIRNKRFFLVLDDMWSDRAWWNLLREPFSHGAVGSRVLITTRHDDVARGMQAVRPFHHVHKLYPRDAWSLLKKQVASSDMEELEIDDMLKDIGMEIIDKCDGLPLAVKVMGGLLRRREKQRADWEQVLQDFIWSVPPGELNDAVYLSYQDLPSCLKQCFLHYSLLPKNVEFYDVTVIGMWISEGFLHGDTDDLEKLGERYYQELIYRNLIEPDVEYADQCVSTMHDVIRSFAQDISRDEALVVSTSDERGKGALRSQKFLRLSVETNDFQPNDELEWKLVQGQGSLRTLIVVGELKIDHGDSLINFTSLRTLHIEDTNCSASLVESLHQLKHLRYLFLECSDIARLLQNISKLKLLQYLEIISENLVRLPNSIVKLGQLRHLDLLGISISGIPRQLCRLTNLRYLYGFPVQADGDWCSLQELGPLAKLRRLALRKLENVPVTSLAREARLGEKLHLRYLRLECSSRLGEDGLVEDEKGVSEEEQRRIEEVLDELTPPLCLENIDITSYFGQRLPRGMMSGAAGAYMRLLIVTMDDLVCCTQLPDGLCQLPCLNFFQVTRAPAIKHVSPKFVTMQPSSSQFRHAHAFPKLKEMGLIDMAEFEEWEWDHQLNNVPAVPELEELMLENCKLRCLPPGLSSQATALTSMGLCDIKYLNFVESFASHVKLELQDNPDLERVTSMPRLQKLIIIGCPKMRTLEGVPELRKLALEDCDMEQLPRYLQQGLRLLTSIALGESGPEWGKLSHVQHVKAYADQGDDKRKWHVLYTREPYSFETNIGDSPSSNSGGKSAQLLLLISVHNTLFSLFLPMFVPSFNCMMHLPTVSISLNGRLQRMSRRQILRRLKAPKG